MTTLQRDMTLPGSAPASQPVRDRERDRIRPVHGRDPPEPEVLAASDRLRRERRRIMSPTQLAKLGTNFASDPICVGPFMYDNRVPGDNVTVIKSPYYYDKPHVHLDKIVFRSSPTRRPRRPRSRRATCRCSTRSRRRSCRPSAGLGLVQILQQQTFGYEGITINIGNKNGIGNLPYTNVGHAARLEPEAAAGLRGGDRPKHPRQGRPRRRCPAGLHPDRPDERSGTTRRRFACTPYDPADAKKLVAASGIPNPTVHLLTPNDRHSG